MKNTKKSKILSLLLCGAMILSTFAFLPARADAADEKQATEATQQTETKDAATQTETKAQDTKTDMEKGSSQGTKATVEEKVTASGSKAVNYTKVAPLVKKSATSKASKAKAAKSQKATQEATAVTGSSPDGLVMDKTATANDDGSYTIKLEAYSTGTVTSVDTSKPTDIVLVLDQSGSMAAHFGNSYDKVYKNSLDKEKVYYINTQSKWTLVKWCDNRKCKSWTRANSHMHGQYLYTPRENETDNDSSHHQFYSPTTRLDVLQEAVSSFVNNVEVQAKKDNKDHRIGIVGFSSNGYQNTELLTGTKGIIKDGDATNSYLSTSNDLGWWYYPKGKRILGAQYGSITNKQYQNALQDVSTDSGKESVANAIDALTARGGTQTLDGLNMASKIFSKDIKNDKDKRNKVVILFTDGATNSDQNETIQKAKELKDQGITVYTVGIFDGADGTPSNNVNTYTGNNKFMHFLSSNYPNATSMQNGGALNSALKNGESYYLSAADADTLKNIFQKISSQIGSTTVNLGSQSVIRDIVSESFDLPDKVSDIDVKTYDCTKYDESTKEATWSDRGTTLNNAVTINSEKKTIDVTGFDFTKNYVAANGRDENDASKTGNFHGRKIVITFKITPRDGFWGGNNVPTNGAASGIYADKDTTTPTGTFDVPTVNVPLNVPAAEGITKNIYLLGDIPEVGELYDFTIPTGDDAWKAAYVEPKVEYDKAAEISNTSDSEVNVKITVSPKFTGSGADGAAITKDSVQNVTGKVNVFKPELTYKDSTVYYGDEAPTSYDSNKVGSTVWKHGDKASTEVIMGGDAPTLDISYDPAAYNKDAGSNSDYYAGGVIATKRDIPVEATVKIGNENVTNHVSFKHKDCDPECGFDSKNEQFLIHVKTCSLTVTKTGGVEGEPYVMNIYKDREFYTSMTIVGNTSVTVKELPKGTYTVQEDTNWAWRYNGKDSIPVISKGVGLSKDKTSGTITVQNHDRFGSYLNGYSSVVENVFGQSKSN